MDLKIYYQKIRDIEASIPEAFPIVVSNETDDGGKAGSCAEVTRAVAAKFITEGTAKLASPQEASSYRATQAAAKKVSDAEYEASRVQLTVVTPSELARLSAKKEQE